MRRVVVTGLGLVTPLASSVESSWNKLIAGKSGIKTITKFDASDLNCHVAGEISDRTHDDGFDPDIYLSQKEQRKIDPFIIYGIAASEQAIKDSGWVPSNDLDREMTGVMIGSGIGGLSTIEHNSILLKEQGPRKVSPFFIPASLINLVQD
jgi:3-oxoacyl-[acyl-carrier-protein] synthase II